MDMTATPLATPTTRRSPPWRPWPFRTPSWRLAITESGLPAAVQQVLLGVVGNTRLLADEKLEVAEELIAHFEDGLQRGRDSDSLIEAFGDPEMAAQLIQQGKQRNRSMKNRIVQAALGLGALSGGGFLTLVILFYWGQPQPSVDYLAQINQPALSAADQDKGWTIYRDLWIKHGFSEGGGFDSKAMWLRDEDGNFGRMVRPDDGSAWEAATQRLTEIEDLLEGFRVGGLRPVFGVPLYVDITDYEEQDFRALFPNRDYQEALPLVKEPLADSLMSVLLPHVQVMREAARLLTLDTRWALEQGDTERATRNIEALLGISSQVTEGKFLVSSLVGYAIHAMTMAVIDECLHSEATFPDAQLQRIHAAVAKAKVDQMVDLAAERAMFMDLVQKTYTDDGQGDGRITAAGLDLWEQVTTNVSSSQTKPSGWSFESVTKRALAPTSLLFLATRKQLTDKADELFQRMEAVIKAEVRGDTNALEAQQVEREIGELSIAYAPIKLLFPAIAMARQATVRVQVSADSVQTALAVIRYQRQHDRWPTSLDELVGTFLERVQTDPFDGQPLRYRLQDDGFVIYSVGVNGVDDGGQAVLLRPDGSFVEDPANEPEPDTLRPLPAGSYIQQNNYPGDWILWPRLSGQE